MCYIVLEHDGTGLEYEHAHLHNIMEIVTTQAQFCTHKQAHISVGIQLTGIFHYLSSDFITTGLLKVQLKM